MKPFPRTLLLLLAFSCSLLLNSCYFNSAGHIFDNASHTSAVFASDIEIGDYVYRWESNQNHYVELPRYRYDTPIITQYPDDDQGSNSRELTALKGETVMVRIPVEFANYLTGELWGTTTPSYMEPEDLSSTFKSRATQIPIVRKPEEYRHVFTYTSPNAAGWYMLGILDWLCIDLPITCLENCMAGAVAFCGAAKKLENSSSSSGSSYSSSGSSYDAHQEYERQNMLQNAARGVGRPY